MQTATVALFMSHGGKYFDYVSESDNHKRTRIILVRMSKSVVSTSEAAPAAAAAHSWRRYTGTGVFPRPALATWRRWTAGVVIDMPLTYRHGSPRIQLQSYWFPGQYYRRN